MKTQNQKNRAKLLKKLQSTGAFTPKKNIFLAAAGSVRELENPPTRFEFFTLADGGIAALVYNNKYLRLDNILDLQRTEDTGELGENSYLRTWASEAEYLAHYKLVQAWLKTPTNKKNPLPFKPRITLPPIHSLDMA